MLTLQRPTMASTQRGRPPKDEDEGTRMVRLYTDLADMIGWIVKLSGKKGYTAAQLVDPLLRPQIVARYDQIKPQVDKIKKAQAEAKKNDPEV
jgi:hypothetical protein